MPRSVLPPHPKLWSWPELTWGNTDEGHETRIAAWLLGIRSADQCRGADRRGRTTGIRLDLDSRVLRFRRPHPSQLVGIPDEEGAPRNVAVPTLRPHPDSHGHVRPHSRSPVGWSGGPRARGLRPTGCRRLVRTVVRKAVGPHP